MWSADEIQAWASSNASFVLGVIIVGVLAVKIMLPQVKQVVPLPAAAPAEERDGELVGAMDQLREEARRRQQEKFEEESRQAAEKKKLAAQEKRARAEELAASDGAEEGRTVGIAPPKSKRNPPPRPKNSGRSEFSPLMGSSGGSSYRPSGIQRRGGGG